MNRIYYGKQYIDEDDIDAVVRVLKDDLITCGPQIGKLEENLCELTGSSHSVAVSNGTAALHLACMAIGIQEGDEVITTPITFAASANAVLYCGGIPIFADINEKTWNIDPKDIERKITAKTKAIIAVDFTGQVAQLNEIKNICKKHNLKLIEDAAHSIGSKYLVKNERGEEEWKAVGNIADITTFSFHPVKTITGGEGGAVLTNDKELYRKILNLRAHGMTDDVSNSYERKLQNNHPVNLQMQIGLGYNYRMTDFQAALISSQLKKLSKFKDKRKKIVEKYKVGFQNLEALILQEEILESDTLRHLYIIRINLKKVKRSRKEISEELAKQGVICNVHYIPVYYHPYYVKLGYERGLCPKAEALYEEILTLPLYYTLSEEEIEHVIDSVRKIVGNDEK